MTQVNDILRPLAQIENELAQIAELARNFAVEYSKRDASPLSGVALLIATKISESRNDLGALYLLVKKLNHEPQFLGGQTDDVDGTYKAENRA